jgi:hypothetical protein
MFVQIRFIVVAKYVAAVFHSPVLQQRTEAIKQLKGIFALDTAALRLF